MYPLKYHLKSITKRKGRLLLTILGVALVVSNFIIMSAMSSGLINGFKKTGSKDNIMVLQKGAMYLDFSSLPKPFLNIIKYIPNVKKENDRELAAPELFISTWVNHNNSEFSLMVRGVTPLSFKIHDQIRLTTGRLPKFAGEIIIGKKSKFILKAETLRPGNTLEMFGSKWTIVGEFEAENSTFESEIWTNLNDLMAASDQQVYSCVVIKMVSSDKVLPGCELLNTSQRIAVKALSEQEYYSNVSIMFIPMKVMGLLITFIAGLGAIFIGINTMYNSVTGRIREIGVLLALGFSRRSILFSFIFEATLISLLGGILGLLLALPLNGASMNMLVLAFKFKIGFTQILQGLILAASLGILGGYFPARRGAKLEIVEAIKAID